MASAHSVSHCNYCSPPAACSIYLCIEYSNPDFTAIIFSGLLSGLAIALHNFPEGLATYVAAIADPASGLAIAVAIALHNIPEVRN